MKTWLYYLNYCVMQWTGFRLAKVVVEDSGECVGWAVVGPVLPMTGWNSPFIGRASVLFKLPRWLVRT